MKRFRSEDSGRPGKGTLPRLMIIDFQSGAAARLFYDSPEYQKILPLRRNSADGTVVIVESA